MDLPAADLSEEIFVDETGFEYKLNAKGEREYYHPEPGEDPEYDAWFIAEVEEALRESLKPDAVFISNDEVKRQMREFWAERGVDIDAVQVD